MLASTGCIFDDVVDVATFHTDPATQFKAVSTVRTEVVGGPPYLHWTAVGVTWLAGFDFEIKIVARLPPPT